MQTAQARPWHIAGKPSHFAPILRLRCTNLGNVLHALGRLDEAQACFREAIDHKPGLVSPHASLAGLLEELGDLDQSRAPAPRDPAA